MHIDPKYRHTILAFAIAAVIALIYIFSGHSSLDANTRQLNYTPGIQKVDSSNPQNVTVKCKNGQTYNILFDPDQKNYDGLIFNACGPDGGTAQ